MSSRRDSGNRDAIKLIVQTIVLSCFAQGTVVLGRPLPTIAVSAADSGSRPKFECWSTPDDLPPYEDLMEPCFAHSGTVQCRCNDFAQDCSSNGGNLTFVPRVSSKQVQALNFSNNNLLRVDDDQFFSNLSRDPLLLVDLYNNNLTSLSPGVFALFHNLTTVLIGGNMLSYNTLKLTVFSVPTLKKLDIKCGSLGEMPRGYFNDARAVHLEVIDLSWNQIHSLNMSALQPLKKLREVTVWHNGLSELDTAYLPSLTYVSFHKNFIQDFPKTCQDGGGESLFPNLTILDLNFNLITEISYPICLPKLRVLNLKYNSVQFFHRNMFSDARFPYLNTLELNQMHGEIRRIDSYAINNSKVEHISFALNTVDFSLNMVSHDMFAGCQSVRSAILTHNDFSAVSVAKFQRLFQHMTRLEALFLGYTKIQISQKTFKYMQNLKILHLYENELFSVPDGVFDGLRSLRTLSLARNHLTGISSKTFGPETRVRLRALDLSGNPFDCSCDIVWFQKWMKRKPRLFYSYGSQDYHCTGSVNVTVLHFAIIEQACLLTQLEENNIIIVVSIVFSLSFILIAVYGYRWHLRLWLYEVCRGRHEQGRRQQERLLRPFQYDVFLAYAEEDQGWVLRELLPALEDEWGLNVCVHQRDFVPGKHIIDNISDCVSDSDRVLMVFSPHFARSRWCQFELRLCQACVMERDDVMVLVMLQETEPRDMMGAMFAVLRTTTYIEWSEEPRARQSFFGRLKLALQDVVSNNVG